MLSIVAPFAANWLPLIAAAVIALMAYGTVRICRVLLANDHVLWEAARRVRPWLQRMPGMRALERRSPAVLRFLQARLSAIEYVGIHVVASALICLLALYLFGKIVLSVIGQKGLTDFDRDAASALHGVTTPGGVEFWGFVSHLGTYPVMGALAAILVILLWRRGERMYVFACLIAMIGASMLNEQMKLLVHRPRPYWAAPLANESTFSFPSGHSLGAVVGYGMLVYGIFLLNRRRSIWMTAAIGGLIIVLAIGYSRMYLGVHFFSDVIGGFALGGFWLAACITGFTVARQRGDLSAMAINGTVERERPRVA